MITVLLVDDHPFFINSLRYMLEAETDIEVVGTAANSVEAIAQVSLQCPDVTVMDISMPVMDAIEATREIQQRCQFTRVMMLSLFDTPQHIQRALEVGASGNILKDTVGLELLAAVRALYGGKRYFSLKISEIVEKYINESGQDNWVE